MLCKTSSSFRACVTIAPRAPCCCRLLIFYTYSGDGEAAEINRAQNAVVPFTMHSSDESFIHPRDGSLLRPTNFPVQLYCRARPWFQIAVYDMATLEVRELWPVVYEVHSTHRLLHVFGFRVYYPPMCTPVLVAAAGDWIAVLIRI